MVCSPEPEVDPILTAAAELFERRGFDEVSMAAIADRAGFGRTTVFRRYDSKAQVLAAIVDAFFTVFPTYLVERELDGSRAGTCAERIDHALGALRAFCRRQGPLARVALGARNLPWLRRRLEHQPEQSRRLARYCLGTASAPPLLCCLLVEALQHAATEPETGVTAASWVGGPDVVRAVAVLAGGTSSAGDGTPRTALGE